MLHNSRWFLGAYCTLRRGQRLFRVDRIASIEMEKEIFEPPENFDMKEFVYRGLAYASDDWKVEVSLYCSARAMPCASFPLASRESYPKRSGDGVEAGATDLRRCGHEFALSGFSTD